jgi:hypothetical protein
MARGVKMPTIKPDEKGEDPSEREILWRQYSTNVDLYKFHTESSIKINGFAFLVTGGILGFVLSENHTGQSLAKFSLLLPIMMSIALTVGMISATFFANEKKKDVAALREKLGLESTVSLTLLQITTICYSVVQIAMIIGLTILLIHLSIMK